MKLVAFDLGVLPTFVGGGGQTDALGDSGPAIGLDLLAQFKVRLDIANRKLWLERTRSGQLGMTGMPIARTLAAGAILGPLDRMWLVLGVLPDTPAAKAGLEAGDVLDPSVVRLAGPAEILDAIRAQQPLLVRRPTEQGYVDVVVPVAKPRGEAARPTRSPAAAAPPS